MRVFVAGRPGVFHVTDDEPTAMHTWLPAYARGLDAPAPRRIEVSDELRGVDPDGVYYTRGG